VKISLVRSGGVAGLRREATVDTAQLDSSRAEELRRMIEEAERSGLFETSSAPRGGGPPDRFGYHLTVEDRRGKREARFSEQDASETATLLVRSVWEASEA